MLVLAAPSGCWHHNQRHRTASPPRVIHILCTSLCVCLYVHWEIPCLLPSIAVLSRDTVVFGHELPLPDTQQQEHRMSGWAESSFPEFKSVRKAQGSMTVSVYNLVVLGNSAADGVFVLLPIPSMKKIHSRKEQNHLTGTKSCQQWLQVLLSTALVGRSTAPSAGGLWLLWHRSPPGHRSVGQEPGTSTARARGGVSSAWAGTLPHLLISVLPGPQGSEQHSCHGPHVPCLCPWVWDGHQPGRVPCRIAPNWAKRNL